MSGKLALRNKPEPQCIPKRRKIAEIIKIFEDLPPPGFVEAERSRIFGHTRGGWNHKKIRNQLPDDGEYRRRQGYLTLSTQGSQHLCLGFNVLR
jgi:hypothetical protein